MLTADAPLMRFRAEAYFLSFLRTHYSNAAAITIRILRIWWIDQS